MSTEQQIFYSGSGTPDKLAHHNVTIVTAVASDNFIAPEGAINPTAFLNSTMRMQGWADYTVTTPVVQTLDTHDGVPNEAQLRGKYEQPAQVLARTIELGGSFLATCTGIVATAAEEVSANEGIVSSSERCIATARWPLSVGSGLLGSLLGVALSSSEMETSHTIGFAGVGVVMVGSAVVVLARERAAVRATAPLLAAARRNLVNAENTRYVVSQVVAAADATEPIV